MHHTPRKSQGPDKDPESGLTSNSESGPRESFAPGGSQADAAESGCDTRDRLLSRVVEGRADAQDWTEFGRLSSSEPGVFASIAGMQSDRAALEAAVEQAIAISTDIEPEHLDHEPPVIGFSPAINRAWRGWGGWAAAAALVLVWVTGLPGSGSDGAPGSIDSALTQPETAGIGASLMGALNRSEMLDRYLAEGKTAGTVVEAPEPVVLNARPTGDGDIVEVVYLRQIVERRFIDRVQRFQTDEHGDVLQRVVPASQVTTRRAAF
ncbi:MAG: hypothetical protein AAF235_01335 [Planctomycetota bacterium]